MSAYAYRHNSFLPTSFPSACGPLALAYCAGLSAPLDLTLIALRAAPHDLVAAPLQMGCTTWLLLACAPETP